MGLMTDAQDDDAFYLMDIDEFGESVTYTPAGASAVTIIAIVDRHPPERLDEASGDLLANHIELFIHKTTDTTVGLSATPNPGRDTVSVPRRIGEVARTMTVGRILEQHTSGWLVAAR